MSCYPQWFEIIETLEKKKLLSAISILSPNLWIGQTLQTYFILRYDYEFSAQTGITISMEHFEKNLHAAIISVLGLPFCVYFNETKWISFAWSNHPHQNYERLKYLEYRGKVPTVNTLHWIHYQ